MDDYADDILSGEDPSPALDIPKLPGSFSRFTCATSPTDDRMEFYESTGTFTGRNLAPPRRQGAPYQRNVSITEGE